MTSRDFVPETVTFSVGSPGLPGVADGCAEAAAALNSSANTITGLLATLYSVMAHAPGTLSGLIGELLCQDAFVQVMAGVIQHGHGDGAVLGHVHGGDIADFEIIGHGADRPLAAFQNLQPDLGAMRQQRAAPAAGGGRRDTGPWPKGGLDRAG